MSPGPRAQAVTGDARTATCETAPTALRSTPSDFLDGILGSDFDSPEDAKPAAAPDDLLHAAAERLTPKQRFVVECAWGLRDGFEYSFQEIAAFMGISAPAVWKHYHAAMKRLEGLTATGYRGNTTSTGRRLAA